MAEIDGLVQANRRFAQTFDQGDLPMPPSKPVAILTCMDARILPDRILGLEVGDAHVLRNAGGRASDDALRSLIISSHLQGTREFMVIHHTDCGMVLFTNDDLRARLRDETGEDASHIDFLPFADLEQGVRDDVEAIRANPLLPRGIDVTGWIYDVRTGRLAAVEGA